MRRRFMIASQMLASLAMPDPRLTPGAILDTDPIVICAPGYPEVHRVWRDKRGTAAKYGIPWAQARLMEDDDLVPVGIGGDNANPAQHWLQPCSSWAMRGDVPECIGGEAYEKDKVERRARREVCRQRSADAARKVLNAWQQIFVSGRWPQYLGIRGMATNE